MFKTSFTHLKYYDPYPALRVSQSSINSVLWEEFQENVIPHLLYTVEPRYNEPLHNEVLSITNDFLYPSNS